LFDVEDAGVTINTVIAGFADDDFVFGKKYTTDPFVIVRQQRCERIMRRKVP